jgi:hypothetical protein
VRETRPGFVKREKASGFRLADQLVFAVVADCVHGFLHTPLYGQKRPVLLAIARQIDWIERQNKLHERIANALKERNKNS